MATAKKTTPQKAPARKTTGAKVAKAPSNEARPKATRTPKADGKLSQLEAAVKVLGEADGPLTTKQMIEAMAAQGYWSSPNGQTPAQTLYSAILRELQKKGDQARFVKIERGQFALKTAGPPKPAKTTGKKAARKGDAAPAPEPAAEPQQA